MISTIFRQEKQSSQTSFISPKTPASELDSSFKVTVAGPPFSNTIINDANITKNLQDNTSVDKIENSHDRQESSEIILEDEKVLKAESIEPLDDGLEEMEEDDDIGMSENILNALNKVEQDVEMQQKLILSQGKISQPVHLNQLDIHDLGHVDLQGLSGNDLLKDRSIEKTIIKPGTTQIEDEVEIRLTEINLEETDQLDGQLKKDDNVAILVGSSVTTKSFDSSVLTKNYTLSQSSNMPNDITIQSPILQEIQPSSTIDEIDIKIQSSNLLETKDDLILLPSNIEQNILEKEDAVRSSKKFVVPTPNKRGRKKKLKIEPEISPDILSFDDSTNDNSTVVSEKDEKLNEDKINTESNDSEIISLDAKSEDLYMDSQAMKPEINKDLTYKIDIEARTKFVSRLKLLFKTSLDPKVNSYKKTLPYSSNKPGDSNNTKKNVGSENFVTNRPPLELDFIRPELSTPEHKIWKKSIMLLHNRVCSHNWSDNFFHPITDAIAPFYSSIVHYPIDLGTLKKWVENGTIKTTHEYRRCIMLMFQNALMYNSEDHVIYKMTQETYKDALKNIDEYLSAASSSNVNISIPII
ncbi:unnamed protein product [Gordionus sp. m RMFG-2023]